MVNFFLTSSSLSDVHEQIQRERTEKCIVIIRFNEKGQVSMKKINPFVLTTALASRVGEIIYAKILNDGNLLVRCANEEQLEKALNLKEIGKLKVASTGRVGAQNGGGCKGVITRMPMSVSMEELKRNLKGGKIMSALSMKMTKEEVKKNSETALIEFGIQGISGLYELPGESVCAKAIEVL